MWACETFLDNDVITFVNVGGGYINDSNNADYGRYIAPVKGTYHFSATVSSDNFDAGFDFEKNQNVLYSTYNGGDGTTSLSAILDLEAGDAVYLERLDWVGDNAEYNHNYNSFSGFLVQ